MTTDARLLEVARQINRVAMRAFISSRLQAVKTEGAFTRHVWEYMRDYFTSGDVGAFIDSMAAEIDNQWNRAFREGAALQNVDPADFEEEDTALLEATIGGEVDFVQGLAEDIDQAIQEGLTDEEFNKRFSHRPPMWGNRYNEVVDTARLHFAGDRTKFVWELGDTEKHCVTGEHGGVGCSDLAGIVMWNKEWEQAGIRPQSEELDCHGFKCHCRMVETNARRTPGGLTRVLDLMTSVHV